MYEDSDLQGWRMGGKPLSDICDEKPDKNGLHFKLSTYNDDGELVEQYGKDWHFLGMWIMYEVHGERCSCDHCKESDGRWGIRFPRCRCRNAWRSIWWRKHNWPCQLSCIRWTLPMYPFVWWRCRYCRKENVNKNANPSRFHSHTKTNPGTFSRDPRSYM